MWDWLASPIDPGRAHNVAAGVSWHARSMVLGWGILAPLAVIVARFFKVLPGQNWPVELDTKVWWRSHWIGQTAVMGLSLIGFALVLPPRWSGMDLHAMVGYAVLTGLVAQAILGIFRGTKGGPTAPAPDGTPRGHHYDMTAWRRMFEALHKSLGYGLLALSGCAILLGLWKANGPVWMWLALLVWWPALIAAFVLMQRRGMAVDTYQAIWGADPIHPGNRRSPPGWGVRRPGDN
jgi:hypothetical protein